MKRVMFVRSMLVGMLVAVCAAVASPAAAQATVGSIKGRVLDPNGKLVVGAEVYLECTSDAGVKPVQFLTDNDGLFLAKGLQAGKWLVVSQSTQM